MVTKKQYPVTTVGYYDLVGFLIDDYINLEKLEMIASSLDTSAEHLWGLIHAKINPLQAHIKDEYEKTDEYQTHKKHQEILKEYRARRESFSKRYGVSLNEYDYCFNIYGEVMNQSYLDEIIAAAKQREQKQTYSGYYKSNGSNYNYSSGTYDYSRALPVINPTYSPEEREVLHKFYKDLAKIYHPDMNRDVDTHAEMVLINRAY